MRRVSEAERFRKVLGEWFQASGRSLPWRSDHDPYAVAVSEFMLQQTTVAAVIPYFHRWMARFPRVEELAAAAETEVLEIWQGLGYYSRARNLLRAATEVTAVHGGKFPDEPEELRKLPGFGPYTAGAVAAFAFDRPVEVIDANIARVLARLGDVRLPVDGAAGRRALSEEFRRWSPPGPGGGRAFVSALMDLGATVCRSGSPDCGSCPVRAFCRAVDPARLPVKKPRATVKEIEEVRGLVLRRGKVGLLASAGPWWKGLWVLPPAASGREIHIEVFTVTRHRVTMRVVAGLEDPAALTFFPADALPPMPSPHARAVAAALTKLHSGGEKP